MFQKGAIDTCIQDKCKHFKIHPHFFNNANEGHYVVKVNELSCHTSPLWKMSNSSDIWNIQ